MTTIDDAPWEPPLAGTEAEHLAGALDRLRATFRWKADRLDADGLRTTVGASTVTIGGLLKHLALVEDDYFVLRLSGGSLAELWPGYAGPGWEWTSAAGDSPETLYALWDGAAARSRARLDVALAGGGLDQPALGSTLPDGGHPSLRRLVCDLIEEYGRHTGHADLIREVIDGRVGEDPPAGWRP